MIIESKNTSIADACVVDDDDDDVVVFVQKQ